MLSPKLRTALTLGLPLLVADCVTKRVAVAELAPHHPREIVSDVVRLTLAYNTDAAMGLSLGSWSRWGFATLALAIIAILMGMLRKAEPTERLRAAAVGCLAAGALGNLLDRLRWDRGVVDFIDIGIGATRFWTFNLADLAVTTGVVLLMVAFYRHAPPSVPQEGASHNPHSHQDG
ncbi:MAG TPA: signal peptidase II [Gemmatimonadales bacterium]|nr:signal peptidase II [Gemmatimonadales bacterium]